MHSLSSVRPICLAAEPGNLAAERSLCIIWHSCYGSDIAGLTTPFITALNVTKIKPAILPVLSSERRLGSISFHAAHVQDPALSPTTESFYNRPTATWASR